MDNHVSPVVLMVNMQIKVNVSYAIQHVKHAKVLPNV